MSKHESFDEVYSTRNSNDDFWASIHKYDDYSIRDDEFDSNYNEIL